MSNEPWWWGAVRSQPYPRGLADANGDGIYDLVGITALLLHIAWLGVEAIDRSPFLRSPQADFRQEMVGYRNVDPRLGRLPISRRWYVARTSRIRASSRIDFAPRPWTSIPARSRTVRDSNRTTRHARAGADPGGRSPNDWQRVSGAPLWTSDARRCRYHRHHVLARRSGVNSRHQGVQAALVDVARFRFDAITFPIPDPGLPDNRIAPDDVKPRTRPFVFRRQQKHQCHHDIPAFPEQVSGLTDAMGRRFTMADTGGADAACETRPYVAGRPRLDRTRLRLSMRGSASPHGDGRRARHDGRRMCYRLAGSAIPERRCARISMPSAADHAGLGSSSAAPWLAGGPDDAAHAGPLEAKREAMRCWTRTVFPLHMNHALRGVGVSRIEAEAAVFAFERGSTRHARCVSNVSGEPAGGAPGKATGWEPLPARGPDGEGPLPHPGAKVACQRAGR